MSWVNMMGFITHCCKSDRAKLERLRRACIRLSAALLCVGFWGLAGSLAQAQGQAQGQTQGLSQAPAPGGPTGPAPAPTAPAAASPAPSVLEVIELRVERTDGALLLQSSLRLDLGTSIEEAVLKGMAIYFVAETEITRDRWYWYDRKVGTATRHFRLAYQPLTRHWRLSVSREPIGAVGPVSSLSQQFESLGEALAAIRRTVNWKVAELADMDPDAKHTLNFKFKLDVSQLPRPFQIAAGSQAEWSLSTQRSLRLTGEPGR